ncbi:HEAT repeat domain-containing protein [Gemmata sp.]|uniref:HEAT repeat domain-containing protein n=1 Tax=Gemmata sp. TaxID=1914242 RepID=UPI003F6F1B1D
MTRTAGWCALLTLVGVATGAGQDKKEPQYNNIKLSAWLEQLKSPDARTRYQAAKAIKEIGPDAKAAVPLLVPLLKTSTPEEREMVAFAVGAVGPAAKDAVPALTDLLKDQPSYVKYAAAVALGQIGPDAKAALPALTPLVEGRDDFNRIGAAYANWQISGETKTAMFVLLHTITAVDHHTRGVTINRLGRMGPAAKEAVPALVTALKDANKDNQRAAAAALKLIDPEAAKAAGVK